MNHLRTIAFGFGLSLALLTTPALLGGCGGNDFSSDGTDQDGSAKPDSDIILGPDASHHDGSVPGDAQPMGDAAHDGPHDGAGHDGESDGTVPGDGSPGDSGPKLDGGSDGDASVGCPTGYLDCNGTCTANDVHNCGTCGHDCSSLPHVSGVTCGTGGVCTFTNADCAPGYAHCTANPDNGCETNTGTSPNCGGCGVTCMGGMPVCNGTGCVSGCMSPTPTLCNNTTCVNTTNDPQNCNGCGMKCPAGPAHSQATCASSACGWACLGGFTGCPTGAPTACDDLTNDPSNCGACGTVCNAPVNGATSCVMSACAPACPVGLPNLCASEGPNGTCVNEGNDVNNCGACGTVCATTDPPPAHATSTCNGTCGWSCDPNYLECNASSCLLQVPDTTAGVFVAQGGATSSCGTIGTPCGTISAGLNVAQQLGGKSILYVAESSTPYTEQVTMVAGITIQGGWVYSGGGTWSHPCALDPAQTVISAPAGVDRTVIATYTGTATLDTLTVRNATVAATGTATVGGQSLYGIFAVNSVNAVESLTVTNVVVNVAAGGNGGVGAQGAAGGAPPTSCSAGVGGNGTSYGPGDGAALNGNYDIAGFHPAQGDTGPTGGTAGNGTAAPTSWPGDCLNVYDGNTTNMACCPVSGGGCNGTCTGPVQVCGTAGSNGCASPPSSGGTGGTGGGSSVGIFEHLVTVSLSTVVVTTAAGGAGQSGGPGGTVVAGSHGSGGSASSTGAHSTCSAGCGGTCCTQTGSLTFGTAGPAGGQGGTGGVAGAGGGGGGGDSYCYVLSYGGSVTGTLSCTHAAASSGGAPNGPPGNAGVHN